MSGRSKNAGDYEVGYAKPPQRTRFRKGQSGNPGGRPRGMTAGRAKALALKEAYRMVRVKEGDSIVLLPAIWPACPRSCAAPTVTAILRPGSRITSTR